MPQAHGGLPGAFCTINKGEGVVKCKNILPVA
jgi:hypothetical protein